MKPLDPERAFELVTESGLYRRRPTPAAPGHQHLSEEELWTLAGYDGGDLAEVERPVWTRALACAECYNRVADLRHSIRAGAVEPTLPFDRIREAVQRRTVQLALEWIGAGLVVRAAAARRIIRTRGPVEDPSTIEQQFGTYAATFTVEAQDADRRLWALRIRIEPPGDVSVRLYAPDGSEREQAFDPDGVVVFTDLAAGGYRLELTGTDVIGVVELHTRDER